MMGEQFGAIWDDVFSYEIFGAIWNPRILKITG